MYSPTGETISFCQQYSSRFFVGVLSGDFGLILTGFLDAFDNNLSGDSLDSLARDFSGLLVINLSGVNLDSIVRDLSGLLVTNLSGVNLESITKRKKNDIKYKHN